MLAFDDVGHGPDDALTRMPQTLAQLASQSGVAEAVVQAGIVALATSLGTTVDFTRPIEEQGKELLWNGPLAPIFHDGRATVFDASGYTLSGADFFTADVFQTRDIVRQSAVDAMTLVRLFRSFDGKSGPPSGDVDGDGTLDAGGASATFAYTGISLGGILGSVIMGADPLIGRADLMVPGGGLADIVASSDLSSVTGRVFGEEFGLSIIGDPSSATGPGGTPVQARVEGASGVGALTTIIGGNGMCQLARAASRTGQ